MSIEIIIGPKCNMLQHYNFVSIENWVNFLNFAIFELWAYYLELKIRVIFNIHKFLTFGLVNENWKLEKIELDWKLGKIQFSKIENRKKLIWPLGTQSVYYKYNSKNYFFEK